MSIPALLNGVADFLGTKLAAAETDPAKQALAQKKVAARFGDNGAPLGMWVPSMGWFVGVYFGGARGSARADGHYCLRYTVGIDITRLIALVGTKNEKTAKLLSENDLHDKANRISELMLSGASILANACNTALVGTWQENLGRFHENFEECTISNVTEPPPSWVNADAKEVGPGNLSKITITASGLAWRKNFENLYGAS